MKTVLAIVIALLIVILVLHFLPNGPGLGSGNGMGDSPSTQTNSNIIPETISSEPQETEDVRFTKTIIALSVVESDYFYNNKKITIDEFVTLMQDFNGTDYVVVITDDNASLRAYTELTDKLKELSIVYSEE